MTVKCTKDATWAIHHAWGPYIDIKVGMVLGDSFPKGTNVKEWDDFKAKLLEAGHATYVKEEVKENDPDGTAPEGAPGATGNEPEKFEDDKDKVSDVTPESLKAELENVALKKQHGVLGSEKKAKDALEVIGKERYSFDVDKRLGLDNMVEAIVGAAFPDKDKDKETGKVD